jgi:hypothetical protein
MKNSLSLLMMNLLQLMLNLMSLLMALMLVQTKSSKHVLVQRMRA